jgi:hypothetical protein
MEKLKVAQVARELGITPAGVYKRLKTDTQLVENHVIKEKGVAYLTRPGVEILRETMQKHVPLSDSTSIQPVESQTVKHLQEVIANQQKTIDNLIGRQAEERQRSDTLLMKLSNDLSNMQKAIEYKRVEMDSKLTEPMKPIKCWKPETPADPLEGLGFLEKIWVQFVEPQKMRKYAS